MSLFTAGSLPDGDTMNVSHCCKAEERSVLSKGVNEKSAPSALSSIEDGGVHALSAGVWFMVYGVQWMSTVHGV
jgi:hypothetical protein